METNLSNYKSELGRVSQMKRLAWQIVWFFLARPLPRKLGNFWKLFLLRIFGAKVHKTAVVYSSARIYAPWNLEMDEYSCLGSEVDCYNVDKIFIGKHATVSQKSYLCTASHDVMKSCFPLITAPIVINEQSWLGASVFIGMGVTIGDGAVIGATSSVFKNVEPWTVVGGNPARVLKKRIINE